MSLPCRSISSPEAMTLIAGADNGARLLTILSTEPRTPGLNSSGRQAAHSPAQPGNLPRFMTLAGSIWFLASVRAFFSSAIAVVHEQVVPYPERIGRGAFLVQGLADEQPAERVHGVLQLLRLVGDVVAQEHAVPVAQEVYLQHRLETVLVADLQRLGHDLGHPSLGASTSEPIRPGPSLRNFMGKNRSFHIRNDRYGWASLASFGIGLAARVLIVLVGGHYPMCLGIVPSAKDLVQAFELGRAEIGQVHGPLFRCG